MDIFLLLDAIQTIARNGLNYAANPYDRERYEQLMALTTQTYGDLLAVPAATIRENFARETGYITPKVGADAAIFNEQGQILLMERADGSGWCLPCGFVDANETPAEGIVREVREETGLEIKVTGLVGVFTRKAGASNGPHTTIGVVHLCEVLTGELRLSHEGSDLRYWPIDDVPYWHPSHERHARASYAFWQSRGLLPAVSE